MLYKIIRNEDSTRIQAVSRTSLVAEGLYEVKDLSQWLASTPSLLCERLDLPPVQPFIVGCEVVASPDFRLDVLGIDPDGTLVVCEVKRDENDPLYQGIMYCGRLYSMPTDDLLALVEKYAKKGIAEIQGQLGLAEDDTLPELWEPQRRSIRLVIVAQDFPSNTFQAARWLAASGVSVSCIRFECFKERDSLYLHPQQVLPSVETAESYAVQRETQQRRAQVRTRNMFYSLIAESLSKVGEPVFAGDGKEIGVVRADHIERQSDGAHCVNFQELTGISGSWTATVKRDGQLVPIGLLRQMRDQRAAAVAEPVHASGEDDPAGKNPRDTTGPA